MQPEQRQQYIELIDSKPVDALVAIMKQLRDPNTGCPWDVKQTLQSIIPHTIEETYEVADAILHGDPEHIKEELGDLLFQVVFYAQIAQEYDWFEFSDVAKVMCEKLIRRHPHVFTDQSSLTAEQVEAQWDAIKRSEKVGQSLPNSILENIPSGLSPLLQAHKIQKTVAKVGFDWVEISPVVDKIKEELVEVEEAIEAGDHRHIEEEIGDLLFAVVNLARHAGVKSEVALLAANQKFTQRFMQVESLVREDNEMIDDLTLVELEQLWLKVKANNK